MGEEELSKEIGQRYVIDRNGIGLMEKRSKFTLLTRKINVQCFLFFGDFFSICKVTFSIQYGSFTSN